MNTIFMVLGGIEYEGSKVLGVYSTREAAEAFAAEAEKNEFVRFDYIEVEEWKVE